MEKHVQALAALPEPLVLHMKDGLIVQEDLTTLRKSLIAKKPVELAKQNAFEHLFPLLFEAAVHSTGVGSYRTVATDCLSICLQRATQAADFDMGPENLTEVVSVAEINALFEYVCDFWTDASPALGNALKDMFTKAIALAHKIHPRETVVDMIGVWAVRVLKMPKSMRVVYFVLEIITKSVGGSFILAQDDHFVEEALAVMGSIALANPVGKTLYAIFSSIRAQIKDAHVYDNEKSSVKGQEEVANWVALWAPTVRAKMMEDMTLQKHILLYFMPQMFKFHPDCFPVFMATCFDTVSKLSETELEALVGCLKIAQEVGLVEVGSSEFVTVEMVTDLLQHESMSLRAAALSLLLSSPKGSEPVKPYVYDVLRAVMADLFAEGDAEFRNKVYGNLRQFTTRVRDSSYALNRDVGRMEKKFAEKKGDEKLQLKLDDYRSQCEAAGSFCSWLVSFVTAQLNPCAPYQTFHTALRLLPMLIKSGMDQQLDSHIERKNYLEFPFSVEIFTPVLVERLIDGVTSNYEDLRQMCVLLLKMSPTSCFPPESISELAERGMTMMAGIRGREGDSGARLTQFVFNLYGRISQTAQIEFFSTRLVATVAEFLAIAQSDLTLAVKEYPVHGYFSALRFILEDVVAQGYDQAWNPSVGEALKLVATTWELTQSILTEDSPEGNIPSQLTDVDDIELKYGPASQLVLSYAWRAVKESTAMMGSILTLVPSLDDSTILECGNLSIEQLATVRHRGAFSSVYPTFVACCRRCAKTATLQDKPREWLNYNIELIEKMAQKITRRSGGLPFLIAGVLCAESDEDRPLLQHTFEELLKIANKPLDEDATIAQIPQVHALNCMRILFIESELSEASAHYVDEGLQLAIERFSSPTWAVRNCAVMLYTSLQNRLFGTKRVATVIEGSNLSRNNTGTVPARLFFSRYGKIRHILLDHLKAHVDTLDSDDSTALETTYPVLSLLSRLEGTNGYSGLDEFRELIRECLRSKVWKIREVAARTYGFMTADDNLYDSILSLAESLPDTSQNYTHGCLLAIDATLARASMKLHQQLPQTIVQKLYALFTPLLKQNPCPVTQIAYFRILKDLYLQDPKAPFSGRLVQFSLNQIEAHPNGKLDAAARVLRQECVCVLLRYSSDSGLGTGIFVSYVRQLFSDSTYEVVQTTIATIEQRLAEFDQETKCSILESLWDLTRVSHCDLVKGPALRLLSTLLKDTPSTLSDSLCQSLLFSYTNEHSTDISESALGALGPFTARVNDVSQTQKWLQLVKQYADETAAFSSRQAALRSLCSYLGEKNKTNDTSTETMEAYVLLLMYLSDDDTNLREMAASFTSELCGLTFASTNVRAEQALLKKLNSETRQEFAPHLTDLFQGHSSLASQIDAALAEDSFLFSTERQNVYRNEPVLLATIQSSLAQGPAPDGSDLGGWLKTGMEHWQAKRESLRPELKTDYNFYLVKSRTELARDLFLQWQLGEMEQLVIE